MVIGRVVQKHGIEALIIFWTLQLWHSSLKRWNCWRKRCIGLFVVCDCSMCNCMFTWNAPLSPCLLLPRLSQQTNVQLELHKLELIGTRIKTRIRIIDLFSCTAASLFNELTYLLTYWNCAFCVELHVRTDRVETGAVWTCLHSIVL